MMRHVPCALALASALACAEEQVLPPEPPPAPSRGEVVRPADLARMSCLVVAPFENASDVPHAADAATGAVLASIDPARARAFPVPELRALFRDTAFELPEGIGPSLALELGQLLGSDGVVYGAVEGRSAQGSALLVSIRVAAPGEHDLAYARTLEVRFRQGESPDAAVRRAVADYARPMLSRLGSPARKACFDRERQARLRALALADARPAQGAARGDPPRANPARGAAGPASAKGDAAAPRPRVADWAKRLGDRGRFVVEDVNFKQRTSNLAEDVGLADLAAAIAAAPGVKVRIEGFVDASNDPRRDAKISMGMAQAAGKRLVELGVPRDRVSWAGRGGEGPLLPNFTARGRAANRRVEAVGLR
jgi:outer membrane protein OmpA-like peptidoglycan-associated protein